MSKPRSNANKKTRAEHKPNRAGPFDAHTDPIADSFKRFEQVAEYRRTVPLSIIYQVMSFLSVKDKAQNLRATNSTMRKLLESGLAWKSNVYIHDPLAPAELRVMLQQLAPAIVWDPRVDVRISTCIRRLAHSTVMSARVLVRSHALAAGEYSTTYSFDCPKLEELVLASSCEIDVLNMETTKDNNYERLAIRVFASCFSASPNVYYVSPELKTLVITSFADIANHEIPRGLARWKRRTETAMQLPKLENLWLEFRGGDTKFLEMGEIARAFLNNLPALRKLSIVVLYDGMIAPRLLTILNEFSPTVTARLHTLCLTIGNMTLVTGRYSCDMPQLEHLELSSGNTNALFRVFIGTLSPRTIENLRFLRLGDIKYSDTEDVFGCKDEYDAFDEESKAMRYGALFSNWSDVGCALSSLETISLELCDVPGHGDVERAGLLALVHNLPKATDVRLRGLRFTYTPWTSPGNYGLRVENTWSRVLTLRDLLQVISVTLKPHTRRYWIQLKSTVHTDNHWFLHDNTTWSESKTLEGWKVHAPSLECLMISQCSVCSETPLTRDQRAKHQFQRRTGTTLFCPSDEKHPMAAQFGSCSGKDLDVKVREDCETQTCETGHHTMEGYESDFEEDKHCDKELFDSDEEGSAGSGADSDDENDTPEAARWKTKREALAKRVEATNALLGRFVFDEKKKELLFPTKFSEIPHYTKTENPICWLPRPRDCDKPKEFVCGQFDDQVRMRKSTESLQARAVRDIPSVERQNNYGDWIRAGFMPDYFQTNETHLCKRGMPFKS